MTIRYMTDVRRIDLGRCLPEIQKIASWWGVKEAAFKGIEGEPEDYAGVGAVCYVEGDVLIVEAKEKSEEGKRRDTIVEILYNISVMQQIANGGIQYVDERRIISGINCHARTKDTRTENTL